ncbi:hypothetical protein ACE1SV_13620 [Streptomyces sp. E-15]
MIASAVEAVVTPGGRGGAYTGTGSRTPGATAFARASGGRHAHDREGSGPSATSRTVTVEPDGGPVRSTGRPAVQLALKSVAFGE